MNVKLRIDNVICNSLGILEACGKILMESEIVIHDCIGGKINTVKVSVCDKNIPKHIYVTDKATVFQYGDKDDKLVLYRKKEDPMDLASAFMWAYTMRTLGISKTQMHKYMDRLDKCIDNVEVPNKKHK